VTVVEAGGLLPDRARHGGLSPLDLVNRILFMARAEFDLVHTFDHRPAVSFAAFVVSRLRRRPWVADWCDLWGREGLGGLRTPVERALLTPADERLEQWTVGKANAVTVVSTELQRRAQVGGRRSEDILLLPPAANDDLIRPQPIDEARRACFVPRDRPVLVFSGYTRLGSALLGEAFARVVQRDPSVLLIMAGGELPDFDRIVSGYGLDESVIRFGEKSHLELSGILACGDVMLVPYPDQPVNRAGFANKLADYLAAGRPIATNRTGDLGALVTERSIGVATADDPAAYADGICRLLEDGGLRAEMGQRARRLAETSFSFRARAEALEELYLRLV
jgi:glycosyltransferase involved in cell wall biosynthesis